MTAAGPGPGARRTLPWTAAGRRWSAGILLVAVLVASGCGSGERAATPVTTPEPTEAPRVSQPMLAIGITEPNPAFVWSATARPDIPAPFDGWRNELSVIDPHYYRLVVDWGALQPSADSPADLDRRRNGCLRATPPCEPWAGLREQLEALASRQRSGGWEGVVVLTGTPEWAASEPSPCERADATPRSRLPRPETLPAYRQLVADVLAAADGAGARLRWWSAWNEPNHPVGLSPQHLPCDDLNSTPAVTAYARLVRELRAALDAAPGRQGLVIGELAGIRDSSRYSTGMSDFFAAMPRELVCDAEVVSLHAYAGGRDPVSTAWTAVRRHRCETRPEVWITETGAGFPPPDLSVARASASRIAACHALDARLREWHRDSRVGAAFQYTFREDDLFRVGLASTSLDEAFPTLRLWQAWGGAREPGGPRPPDVCAL